MRKGKEKNFLPTLFGGATKYGSFPRWKSFKIILATVLTSASPPWGERNWKWTNFQAEEREMKLTSLSWGKGQRLQPNLNFTAAETIAFSVPFSAWIYCFFLKIRWLFIKINSTHFVRFPQQGIHLYADVMKEHSVTQLSLKPETFNLDFSAKTTQLQLILRRPCRRCFLPWEACQFVAQLVPESLLDRSTMILCKSSRCTPAWPVPVQRGCGRLRLSHSQHEPGDQEHEIRI